MMWRYFERFSLSIFSNCSKSSWLKFSSPAPAPLASIDARCTLLWASQSIRINVP